MDTDGSGVHRSQRAQCQANHPCDCDACARIVFRQSCHSHHFDKRGRQDRTICAECDAMMALAARPIIDAAEGAGVKFGFRALDAWIASGNVGVLITKRMDSNL